MRALVTIQRHSAGLTCPVGIGVASLVRCNHVSIAREIGGLGKFLSAEIEVPQGPARFWFDQGTEGCIQAEDVLTVRRLVAACL